jgi:hypothetical protein
MKHLTVVYELPNDFDTREITQHDRIAAISWSHAIHGRDAVMREVDRLRAEVATLRKQKLVLEYPPPDLLVYEPPKLGEKA